MQGPKGDKGDKGDQGIQGLQGPAGPAGTTGQNSVTLVSTGTINPAINGGFVLIPNLSTTINVPAGAVVVLSTDGGIQTTSGSTTGFSRVDIALAVDGAILPAGGFRRVSALNNGGTVTTIENYAMSMTVTLAAGNHTFAAYAGQATGSLANVSGDSNSVLQGTLTITILKQ